MKRKSGTGLVANELTVLRIAARLAREEGHIENFFHGYQLLLAIRADAESSGRRAMNHATLYRCLRRLEERGLLTREAVVPGEPGRPPRTLYRLTGDAEVIAAQFGHEHEPSSLGSDRSAPLRTEGPA